MIITKFLSKIIFLTFIIAIASSAIAESNKEKLPSMEASTANAEDLYKAYPDDVMIGNKDAKVTIIEYASLTCSHCADFHKNTYPEVKEKYIDTGKVNFIFRSFPLDEPALRGSMLAYCSGEDKFYKFIDVMFTTQPNWAFNKNYLEVLANIGKLGGLNSDDFDKCMANSDLERKIIQKKFDAATILNVRATPTFFVNGNIYKGAHGFEYFSKVLDSTLAEKNNSNIETKTTKTNE
jgi:protein-disulfide isomerase